MHHDSSSVARATRAPSPDRWQGALARALRAGLSAEPISGGDAWHVASASRPGVVYRSDGIACACEAGTVGEDAVCLHRALVRHLRGLLPLAAPALPATIPHRTCPACSGGGVIYVRACARAGWPHPTCETCQGTGEVRYAPLAA